MTLEFTCDMVRLFYWHGKISCLIQTLEILNFVTYMSLFGQVKVASLRQRFNQSIAPGGLAGDRRGVVPASGFSFSSQEIWRVIKENKDLDLPAHKVICQNLL